MPSGCLSNQESQKKEEAKMKKAKGISKGLGGGAKGKSILIILLLEIKNTGLRTRPVQKV